MKNILSETKKWNELGAKEKAQLLFSGILIAAAIILVFVCFGVTLEVGSSVLAASGEFLATALALLGLTMMVRTSLIDIRTQVEQNLKNNDNKDR